MQRAYTNGGGRYNSYQPCAQGGSAPVFVFSSTSCLLPKHRPTETSSFLCVLFNLLPYAVPLCVVAIALGSSIGFNFQQFSQWDRLQVSADGFCSTQTERFQDKLVAQFINPCTQSILSLCKHPFQLFTAVVNRFCDKAGWSNRVRLSVNEQVANSDRAMWEQQRNVTIATVDPVLSPNGDFISIGKPIPKPANSSSMYYPNVFSYPEDDTTSRMFGLDLNSGARHIAFLRATSPNPKESLALAVEDARRWQGFLSDAFYMIAGNGATKDMPHPIGIAYVLPPVTASANGGRVFVLVGGFNLHHFITTSISPPSLELSGMRVIITVNQTRVYETVAFSDMGPDSPIKTSRTFSIAWQSFRMDCIPTESRLVYYVNIWRFVTPVALLVSGTLAAVALRRFLRQILSLKETTADIEKWMRHSEAILQAADNPMLTLNADGNISGLNQPFLALTGHTSDSLREKFSITSLLQPVDSSGNQEDMLRPGRREVIVFRRNPDLSPIEAILNVSNPACTTPIVHKVLVLTDLSEKRRRDERTKELIHLIQYLNKQQQHVLCYISNQLSPLISSISVARDIPLSPEDAQGVDLAIQHLTRVREELEEFSAGDREEQSSLVGWDNFHAALSVLGALIKFARIMSHLDVSAVHISFTVPHLASPISPSQTVEEAAGPTVVHIQPLISPITMVQRDWAALGRGGEFHLLGLWMITLRKLVLAQCGGSIDTHGHIVSVKVPV
ncbi:hypothetical protein BCR44DRAFT_1446401, partial [Catenaria anguillulae PL171]